MRPYLLHATHSNKAKAIEMRGFRIGPKTKRATACDVVETNGYEVSEVCIRREAYQESETMLENVRRDKFPDRITRQGAVFFFPIGGSIYMEPEIFKTSKEDEWGRELYDFGYGKDTMFVVFHGDIPCKCGVGNIEKSDEIFRGYYDRAYFMDTGRMPMGFGDPKEIEDIESDAESFWKEVKEFDPETFNSTPPYENYEPEVWCPCAIPKKAIEAKYDKNNPPTSEEMERWT